MSDLRFQLEQIKAEHGVLTAPLVVDVARPEDHPMHHRFEWDDEIAGENYRVMQARTLIRSVKITMGYDTSGPKQVREWLSTRRADGSSVYEKSSDVVRNDIAYQLTKQAFIRAITALQRNFGHLEEFAEIMRNAANGGDQQAG